MGFDEIRHCLDLRAPVGFVIGRGQRFLELENSVLSVRAEIHRLHLGFVDFSQHRLGSRKLWPLGLHLLEPMQLSFVQAPSRVIFVAYLQRVLVLAQTHPRSIDNPALSQQSVQ